MVVHRVLPAVVPEAGSIYKFVLKSLKPATLIQINGIHGMLLNAQLEMKMGKPSQNQATVKTA